MANKNAVRLGGAYVEITADNGKLIAGLHDSEERVKNFSSEFAKAGAAFSGIGLGIAAPMKEAVDSFAEFEKQMLMTRAVTRSTDAQMRRLTAQAKELGATTSWTASQVAEGMLSLGRMGFKNSEIKQTISSVMDLGRALNIDVATASKELGAVMRQFGASSREAGHYADVLATATNSAAIEMSELLETMKYVGTAGNALGADVETVLALTMALRDTGVSASQAGTQLRSMFLKLQTPKNIKLFGEKFETDIYDAQGRLRSFIDILVDAQARAATMGDKLAVVARQMFGTLQAPAFVSLMKTKNLERFRDMLYDCDGAAEKFRESMESGVYGALKLTESAVEAVGLQLGETLEPSMRDVVTLVQDVSTVVRGFIQDNRPLINMLAETGVAFTTVGGAILAGTGIVKGLAGVTSLTVGVFGRVIEAWRKAGVEVTELASETNVAADAMERLNASASGDALAESLGRANAAAKEVAASVAGLNSEMESLGKGTTQKTGFGLEPEIRHIDTRGMAFSEPVLYATNVANGTYKVRRRNSRAHVNADSQEGLDLMRERSESERAARSERAASVRDARNWADDAMITSVQNDIRRSTKELNAEHERIRRANTPTDAGIQQATDNLNQAIDVAVASNQELEAQREVLAQTGKVISEQNDHWEEYKASVSRTARHGRERIKNDADKQLQENAVRTEWEIEKARDAGEKEAASMRETAAREIASAREDIRAANASVSGLTPVEPFTTNDVKNEIALARERRKAGKEAPGKAIANIKSERKAMVRQANTAVNAAWQKKYRDVDTRTTIRGAAEEYISETAGPWAELQAALDKGDIRGAGKRYEQTRNGMVDAAIKDLMESYEGAELKYLTSAILANGDPEKLKAIPKEFSSGSVTSFDYMRNGHVDSEGVAIQGGMEFITDKRAKELQAKAKEILSPINRKLAPLKAKANKEQAALNEFASLTVDARNKFDAITRETLGDGADALRDTYEKRGNDLDAAKKKLQKANDSLENPQDHVKKQMAERAATADSLENLAAKQAKEIDSKKTELLRKNNELKQLENSMASNVDVDAIRKEMGVLAEKQMRGAMTSEDKLRYEKIFNAIDSGDFSALATVSKEAETRKTQLLSEIATLQSDLRTLESNAAKNIISSANNKQGSGSDYAKLVRTADAKAEDVRVKEQDLLNAKGRLEHRLSPEGQAELAAERREDIIGFARKQDERLAESVAKANAHRADEYTLNTQELANQDNAFKTAVSVANQKRSDYVAYKKTADETKKAADAVVAGAEERIKNAEELQANADNVVPQAVENVVAEGKKREEKIRADAETLTNAVNKNEADEVGFANKQIDANNSRYKHEEARTRASENAAEAANKRVDKAQENVAKTRKQTEQNQKKLNLEISNETGITTKNAERAVKDLEKSRKDVFKVNEETFLSDMENITTKFDAQAETYDALGKTIASGAGKNDYTTFSTGANFSTTGEISTAKLTSSALDDEKKKLQDWGRKLVQQEKDLKKTELEWHDANNAWQEAVKDRRVSPEERRKRLNETGARARELEERYNNETNAFYENKGKFHSAVSDWKKRRDAWSPSVSAPPTPPEAGISLDGNLDLRNTAVLSDDYKSGKELRDAAARERDRQLSRASAATRRLDAMQRQDPEFIRELRDNNWWEVKGRTYTDEERRLADKVRKRDKRYDEIIKRRNANAAESNARSERFNASFVEPAESMLSGRSFEGQRFAQGTSFNDFRQGAVNADNFKINADVAQSFKGTKTAIDDATESMYKFNTAEEKAVVNGETMTLSLDGAAKSANNLGKTSKAGALGMQALKFAGNGALSVMRMFAGMAVSMIAWTAVLKVFEGIANYAHKAAEDMRKAQESNSKIFDKDKQIADEAMSEAMSDEEKIDKLVSIAGSNRTLNNVEGRQLDALYDDLNNRGIVRGWVMPDPTTPTGYRVLNAGAADAMKGNAALYRSQELKAQGEELNVDLHSFDPSRFRKGVRANAEQVANFVDEYAPFAAALEKMTDEQKNELFGEKGFWHDGRLSTTITSHVVAGGNKGVSQKFVERLDEMIASTGVKGSDVGVIRNGLLRLEGVNPNTLELAFPPSGNGPLDKGILGVGGALKEFQETRGESFLSAFRQLKEFGATSKAAKDLAAASEAYFADAEENRNKPYQSDADSAKSEAELADAAIEREQQLASLDAMLAKTEPSVQRTLNALNEEFEKYKATVYDKNGQLKEGVTDEQKEAYLKREKAYQEKKLEYEKKITDEVERRAEEENKARSEERNAYLTGRFRDVVKAIANNDADAAKMNEGFFDSLLVNRKMFNGVDLSNFYRESANLIKDSIEKTNVTLSSRSTMNTYEAMDMSRDVQIDVQKQQLAELRAANSTFRNIYAWMQQDEQYKEYL